MNNIPLHLALSYLLFNKKDKNISLMIKVCFIGILIGTFALTLTLIITNGFEKTIHEKIQGINSQAIIQSPGNKLDFETLKTFLLKKFPKDIKALSQNSIKQAIFEFNGNQSLLIMKGIDPINEFKVTNLEKKIIDLKKPFLLKNNDIIIGYKIAKSWKLSIGDTIKVLVPEGGTASKIYLTPHKLHVIGIFNIGLDEYDSNLAFCSLQFLNKIFDETGADQILLKFNSDNETPIIKKLRESLQNLEVYSWKDLYPALVSSLKLEKYVMFIIIALITLVASLNMISLLFIQIQQKKRDIAIFKTMGMSSSNIQSIFLIMGLLITFIASLTGLFVAAITGLILEHYPFIELPDVYYVSHLPARVEPQLFIIVFICTMLLGFLATWIPAKRASKINITEVLRME